MKITKIGLIIFLSSLVLNLSPTYTFAETDFQWGSYFRLRHEYWKNPFDAENSNKDNRNFFRMKSSLWAELGLKKNINIYAKLTNETRIYNYYYQKDTTEKNSRFNDLGEIVFDNLYIDLKNLYGFPLDLRIGRQNISPRYGEGFIFGNGTPQDGSRTYYFNAIKANYHINKKNQIIFFAIRDDKHDDYLPIIDEEGEGKALTDTDEKALALYHIMDSVDKLHLENYYIFKKEALGGPKLRSKKCNLYTLGSFAKYELFKDIILRGQFADQFGDYGHNSRHAFGGYIFSDFLLKKLFWSPKISLGFVYLSGDDPATSSNEAWDPLFSRWPQWSELYGLLYTAESGIYYWTNLNMFRVSLSTKPREDIDLDFNYSFLRSNEKVSGSSFDDGYNRGHLFQTKLSYNFTKNITSYFLAEYFIPGNFYTDSKDESVFLRTQLEFKF